MACEGAEERRGPERCIGPASYASRSIDGKDVELVYAGGKTDVLLSAETVEDMRTYAGLLGLVYGGMKFEKAGSYPAFLLELPAIMGWVRFQSHLS